MGTITIVSPGGNPEVWPEDKAAIKLQQGYKAYDVWQAEQKALAGQEYQEWLNNPDTVEKRFRMLRTARDSRIAATDYLMSADYPITEEQRELVMAYRTALRDLPAQPGAPWDGGGELTPWPEVPVSIR